MEEYINPDFSVFSKCYDWKNWILDEHKSQWQSFSLQTKKVLYEMAVYYAGNEEWNQVVDR